MGIYEHSVLFCHDLSSGGLGLPTFDRIEKLLEIGTIYEAAKTSISLYIPCIIALRSIVLFLVPHGSKPELILGQYTPKRQLCSRISGLLLETSTQIVPALFLRLSSFIF